ncbi:dehydrodolichyl diphosphate synthase subunit isoform X2 [Oratosquilla oratoria]|uniref:dehydrodolichyl diphosphate synthase subunit isoform X2 n=1 Tax=Oratosquilla oratoria TaxID=337810 RepID=UPI003F76D7CB
MHYNRNVKCWSLGLDLILAGMGMWVVEQKRSWAEWLVINILRVGPLPKHVAIIMDGNRRFARQQQKETIEGHTSGFQKLGEVLQWCRDLNIQEVTLYAFSIENFKRSKQEVNGLMALAAEKFGMLLKETDQLAKHGVRIQIIGDLSLLPENVRKLAAQAVLATEDNKGSCVNLALAYTSREEISRALSETCRGVAEGQLQATDISEVLLEQCLYTRDSRDPDILLRTSGEVRLSDFMIWQTGFSCLFFTKVLWPEFSIWHLFAAVFYYQRHYHTLTAARNENLNQRNYGEEESDIECCRRRHGEVTQENIAAYTKERNERIEIFLADLKKRRRSQLKEMSEICLTLV